MENVIAAEVKHEVVVRTCRLFFSDWRTPWCVEAGRDWLAFFIAKDPVRMTFYEWNAIVKDERCNPQAWDVSFFADFCGKVGKTVREAGFVYLPLTGSFLPSVVNLENDGLFFVDVHAFYKVSGSVKGVQIFKDK